MAIQVINDPYRYGGPSQQQQPTQRANPESSIWNHLATGLGKTLHAYADNKLSQLQKRQQSSESQQQYGEMSTRLQALGLSPEEAEYLAVLPPKEQVGLLQQLAPGLNKNSPEEDQSFLGKIARSQAAKQGVSDVPAANKDYNSAFEKRRFNASREKELAEEALDLLDTGNVASGFRGLLPEQLQTSETQQFDSAVNELATILAERGGGPGSKYRTQLAQQIKASSTKSPKAQKALLERVLKQVQKIELEEQIRNKLIEENNGNQPNNFSDLVSKRVKQLEGRDLIPASPQEKSILPSPSEYENTDIIEDDETGDRYQLIDRTWYKIKE